VESAVRVRFGALASFGAACGPVTIGPHVKESAGLAMSRMSNRVERQEENIGE